MSDDSPFEAAFAALSTYFVGDRTMEETLHRVAALACEAVTGTAYAGITMMRNAKAVTAVFTDDAAPEIDQAQYDAGSGPCLDAFRTGEIHSIVSTRDDTRSPELSAACVDHGIFSTLSLPLTVEDETNGALNLYATVAAAYGGDETKTTSLFAAQAAIVLANASAYWGARAKTEELEEALANRAVIGSAEGHPHVHDAVQRRRSIGDLGEAVTAAEPQALRSRNRDHDCRVALPVGERDPALSRPHRWNIRVDVAGTKTVVSRRAVPCARMKRVRATTGWRRSEVESA